MEFRQYVPTKLKTLATFIWEQKTEGIGRWQILPSGYVELIFNLSADLKDLHGKKVGEAFNPMNSFCFLSGLHTKPLYMDIAQMHNMGIQMHPIAVKAVFGVPASELKDFAILGEDIWKEIGSIEDQLRSKVDFLSRAKWLEEFLYKRIVETNELHTAFRIRNIIQNKIQINFRQSKIKIEDMTGYSRMHTHKLFTDWYALAPNQTIRLHKFIRAIQLMHESNLNLTDLGYQSGFYDQAHFIRVFREFSNGTPGYYKKNRTAMKGQLPY